MVGIRLLAGVSALTGNMPPKTLAVDAFKTAGTVWGAARRALLATILFLALTGAGGANDEEGALGL
jgi:hypothetical protein